MGVDERRGRMRTWPLGPSVELPMGPRTVRGVCSLSWLPSLAQVYYSREVLGNAILGDENRCHPHHATTASHHHDHHESSRRETNR